jgi:hypothetical protein
MRNNDFCVSRLHKHEHTEQSFSGCVYMLVLSVLLLCPAV